MRRIRLAALIVILIVVLAAALIGGFAIYDRGPGLDSEASRLADVLQLHPGMIVADVGAGKGRMAARVAARVGPSGKVYATEINPGLLRHLRSSAPANMAVIEAGERHTNLPDACCDAIYLRRVYHHLDDPVATADSLYSALRPGGRLVVIDFITPRWMFFSHHGVAAAGIRDQLVPAGFVLERRIERWSALDYCLVFHKPRAPQPQPGSRSTSG